MDTGTEQYVFIDKGDGYVQPRRVKVSAEAGEKVGIEQGLKPGERVVTGANFVVDSESRLKGAFAGMGVPSQAPAGAGAGSRDARDRLRVGRLLPALERRGALAGVIGRGVRGHGGRVAMERAVLHSRS